MTFHYPTLVDTRTGSFCPPPTTFVFLNDYEFDPSVFLSYSFLFDVLGKFDKARESNGIRPSPP